MKWVYAAVAGVVIVTLALVVVALVLIDKTHFGWMVGSSFLQIITSVILIGALVLLIAAIKMPGFIGWRRVYLIVWALVALTSPLFGIMFLLPWVGLMVGLPGVIAILYREARSSSSAA